MPMVRVRHSGSIMPNITTLRYLTELIRLVESRTVWIFPENVSFCRLGHKPSYSLASLLSELTDGDTGPPRFDQ